MSEATKHFACEFYGDYALFSEPLTRVGGEKFTYDVPTYEAIKGMLKSVYWKPTFEYVIDKVRVMNEIRTQNIGTKGLSYNEGIKSIFNHTKLCDVRYQVLFHIEWNLNHPELETDRSLTKHGTIIERCIDKGGRQDVFLGTRDCMGYVVPAVFGMGKGFYDEVPEYYIGNMYHSITYPDTAFDDATKDMLTVNFARDVVMKNGVITFLRPEECAHKPVREVKNGIKTYEDRKNIDTNEEI